MLSERMAQYFEIEPSDVSKLEFEPPFSDSSYYDMWCVKIKGDGDWTHTYHCNTKEQAELLIKWITGVVAPAINKTL